MLIGVFFLLSIPATIQGEPQESLYRLQSIAYIILFLHACGLVLEKQKITAIAAKSVKIFLAFCILSLVFIYFNPNYPSPLNEQLSVINTGLGGSRTGWSPSIAIYLPWIYSGGIFTLFFMTIGLIAMIANQILVAGRTGMVASILPYLFWSLAGKSKKRLAIAITLILIGAYYASNNLDALRIDIGGFQSASALDELSTGRIRLYQVGSTLR